MVGIPRSEPCRPQEHTGRCLVGEPRKRLPPPPGTCAWGPKLFGDQVKTRGGFKACRVISPGNQRLRPPPQDEGPDISVGGRRCLPMGNGLGRVSLGPAVRGRQRAPAF